LLYLLYRVSSIEYRVHRFRTWSETILISLLWMCKEQDRDKKSRNGDLSIYLFNNRMLFHNFSNILREKCEEDRKLVMELGLYIEKNYISKNSLGIMVSRFFLTAFIILIYVLSFLFVMVCLNKYCHEYKIQIYVTLGNFWVLYAERWSNSILASIITMSQEAKWFVISCQNLLFLA